MPGVNQHGKLQRVFHLGKKGSGEEVIICPLQNPVAFWEGGSRVMGIARNNRLDAWSKLEQQTVR